MSVEDKEKMQCPKGGDRYLSHSRAGYEKWDADGGNYASSKHAEEFMS